MKILDKIRYILRLPIYIGERIDRDGKGFMPYYKVYCNKHGWHETYPSGYKKRLICLECFKENIKKI